jgi:thiosulfate/3-mercaptopyruvate sulfurtransferase
MELPGPLVSSSWLSAHRADVVVADVRWYLDGRSGREAYQHGHIAGSVFIDLDHHISAPAGSAGRHPLPSPDHFAEAMGELGIGDGTTVIAFDDARGMVAGRLWWMLDSLGESAAVLDGGIDMWTEPLETQIITPEVAEFTERPWPTDRFATADQVAGRRDDTVLLDARAAERFAGEANEVDPRFGHIPGAISAPFAGNMNEGRFLPATELRDRFASLGVTEDSDVVAYCGSGVSACSDLMALREAGVRNLRLYTGSWSEWGADTGRPIEARDNPI